MALDINHNYISFDTPFMRGGTTTLYVVRAGRHGEWEQINLSNGITTIGWVELPDLSKLKSKDELRAIYLSVYPKESEASAENRLSQVWRFAKEMSVGDYVAMPLKTQSAVAIGRPVLPNTRPSNSNFFPMTWEAMAQ